MTGENVVHHPRRAAAIEKAISDLPEANALRDEICRTVQAYADFLDAHGLVDFEPFMEGTGAPPELIVRFDWEGFDFYLAGGALFEEERAHPDFQPFPA